MMEIVGKYIELFNLMTGQSLPCGNIYQSAGLRVHIEKHHPTEIDLLEDVALIIAEPEYIGRHPKEPDSVELVKCLAKMKWCVSSWIKRKAIFMLPASMPSATPSLKTE